jgi:hypothetical protein
LRYTTVRGKAVQLKLWVGAGLRLGRPDYQPAAGQRCAVKALDALACGGLVEVDPAHSEKRTQKEETCRCANHHGEQRVTRQL